MKKYLKFILLTFPAVASAQIPYNSDSLLHSKNASLITVDHMGFVVSSLDDAIRFWTEALGFTLERRAEMGGDFLYQVTGVNDPHVNTAIVKSPNGSVVELLQYSKGRQNGIAPESAGAIGDAHLALNVDDLNASVARVRAAGWELKGSPQMIENGPRKGTLAAYISGPDHIIIELLQKSVP